MTYSEGESEKPAGNQLDQVAGEYRGALHNRHRLLVQHRTGYYLALLAAIRFKPEPHDWELILAFDSKQLPAGFAYFKLIEAVEESQARQESHPKSAQASA